MTGILSLIVPGIQLNAFASHQHFYHQLTKTSEVTEHKAQLLS